MTGFNSKRDAAADKLQEPAQEPVAWVCHGVDGKNDIDFEQHEVDAILVGTMLYTAPPQREWVGLTDDEVNYCIKFPNRNLFARDGTTSQRIARAIEAKLKERNHGT